MPCGGGGIAAAARALFCESVISFSGAADVAGYRVGMRRLDIVDDRKFYINRETLISDGNREADGMTLGMDGWTHRIF